MQVSYFKVSAEVVSVNFGAEYDHLAMTILTSILPALPM
jgi:hypothetical protein